MTVPKLQIQYTSNTGETTQYNLQEELRVGRAFACDIILSDLLSSREHARFFKREDEYWVEDLGSSNGSFLNGRRLLEATRIHDGDVLSIGQCRFTVQKLSQSLTSSVDKVYVSDVVGQTQPSQTLSENPVHAHLLQTIVLLPKSSSLQESAVTFARVIQEAYVFTNVELWATRSQSMRDIFSIRDPGISSDIVQGLSLDIQQAVWQKQAAVCLVDDKDSLFVVPIVVQGRTVGVFTGTSVSTPSTQSILESLIIAMYAFSKEWISVEPWIAHHTSHIPFVTSLQWLLAPISTELVFETFQEQQHIYRAVLRYLYRDLPWIERDKIVVECAMVFLHEGCETEAFKRQMAWVEQGEDFFAQSMTQVLQEVCKQSVSGDQRVQIVHLCQRVVEQCVNNRHLSTVEIVRRLNVDSLSPDILLSETDILIIFDIIQQIEQQEADTQLFHR